MMLLVCSEFNEASGVAIVKNDVHWRAMSNKEYWHFITGYVSTHIIPKWTMP